MKFLHVDFHVKFSAEHFTAYFALEPFNSQMGRAFVVLERGRTLKRFLAVLTFEFRTRSPRMYKHMFAEFILVRKRFGTLVALHFPFLVFLMNVGVHVRVVIKRLTAKLAGEFHLFAVRTDVRFAFETIPRPREMELHMSLHLSLVRERSFANLALDFLFLMSQ